MDDFSAAQLPKLCDLLAQHDSDLAAIIERHGYPPFWSRPNTFETLVHIILEQQVSLASARAALEKLRTRLGEITPEALLTVPDEDFTALYVSRQKKVYLQGLARAITDGSLQLDILPTLADEAVRNQLTQLKGIGNWTTDIYLIMVLRRPDVFPFGDVAAVSALRELKSLPRKTSTEALTAYTLAWQPYRTIATILLWHNYLALRGRTYA